MEKTELGVIELNDFELLVLEMRNSQKNYFKTRNPIHLNNSKRIEKEVDLYLSKKMEVKFPPNLFTNENS